MEMKLKSLEEEGIKETYTKDACVNLENVRRRLLSKIDMVTCEVRNIKTCSILISLAINIQNNLTSFQLFF